MIAISVGPDDTYMSEDDFPTAEWVIYWYERGDWRGSGLAVWKSSATGKLYERSLSHCSCNGPTDNPDSEVDAGEIARRVEYDADVPGRRRDPGDYMYDCDTSLWRAVADALARGGVPATVACELEVA